MKIRAACCVSSAILVLVSVGAAWPQQSPPSTGPEITFKTETNLVLVPVVVRDASGNAVPGLRKEDFQLFDKGKPQAITSFVLEDTAPQIAVDRSIGSDTATKAPPMAIAQHFVALLFDDLHMKQEPGAIGDFGDLAYSRDAALKFIDAMQPGDRVALFAASGETMVDFTSDREKLKQAALKLRQNTSGGPVGSACAVQNYIERQSRSVVMMSASIVRRMAPLPGPRTVVLISSGMILDNEGFCSWSLIPETMQLVDHAVRARVVFNALDARGLAVTSAFDFQKFQAQATYGTGGRFITDTNDLGGGLRRLAATPQYIYVLGFSPETLKPDGKFHTLTVKLAGKQTMDVQARKGYWAPDQKELARRQEQPAASPDVPVVDEVQSREVAEALTLAHPEAAPPGAPAPEPSKGGSIAAANGKQPKNDEVVTSDQPATFRVRSNLVEVPVVVRDRTGHAVGNLRQDDFRIFDKGKRQEITQFSVEKAGAPAATNAPPHETSDGQPKSTAAGASAIAPDRFVAFVFDDVHARFEDLPQVRAAVLKYVQSALGPRDRVALYTTSGRNGVDFTDRPEALGEALLKITPSPLGNPHSSSCDAYVSYFQAVQVDQQVGLQPVAADTSKSLALRVAVEEFNDFDTALREIRDSYYTGLQETRAVLAALKTVVQRMAAAPGQRGVVLVSPGFFVPADLQNQSSELMALAVRSKVLISSVDARGVWTNSVYSACQKGGTASTIQDEAAFRDLDGQANADELIALAEGTGGTVNVNNDFDGGVRKAAAAPEYLYILGFAPQNLKLDGSFHGLKVTVGAADKVTLQARRGYWAPKHAEDEMAVSKQEIEEAVFSRDEIHNLPVEMHTQVTKAGEKAKLNVLTSVDLKSIRLRKSEDRNRNDLTIVAALFDPNGNFVAGTQKLLQLRLRDETVSGLEQNPAVVITTDFDVKPGPYLVRLVVRDAEGQQITAENAAVQIP